MRALVYIFAVVSLVLSVAYAQDIAQLPPCATQCMTQVSVGDCKWDDDACLCKSPQFLLSSSDCLTSNCNTQDLQKALLTSQSLCQDAGAPLPAAAAAQVSQMAASKAAVAAAAGKTITSNPSSADTVQAQFGFAAFSALALAALTL